jgi:prolyl-tRNA editing enzyme YbaK/EbsC (Cys-tRNA(Pro) deacylase)
MLLALFFAAAMSHTVHVGDQGTCGGGRVSAEDGPAGSALDASSRAIEERVRAQLARLALPCMEIACDPGLADTAAFCAHYGYPLEMSANTIVVAARKEPGVACACVVLATDRLDVNHTVCDLLGVRKASFAPADVTRELTGMLIGGVTPFGLPESLALYIDSRVMDREAVIVGGGSRSLKLQVTPSALAAVPGAQVVIGLALG